MQKQAKIKPHRPAKRRINITLLRKGGPHLRSRKTERQRTRKVLVRELNNYSAGYVDNL